jgi:hypothetical protein
MPFSLDFAYFTNFKYFKTLVKHRCFSIPNFGGAHSLCGESPTCARATISALGILRLPKIAFIVAWWQNFTHATLSALCACQIALVLA